MRKMLFTTLMATAAFASASADTTIHIPASTVDLTLPSATSQETSAPKRGFVYLQFTAAEEDLSNARALVPGLGIGYRRLTGSGAADISVSGLGYKGAHKNHRVFWTAPKASFLHYLAPDDKQSAYMGAGLAWGGVNRKEHTSQDDWDSESQTWEEFEDQQNQEFIGIIPSLTFGYEFMRKGTTLGFSELTVSQPALAIGRSGAFPGPIAELSVGCGF